MAGVLLLPVGESLRQLSAEGGRRLFGLVDFLVEFLEVALLAPRPDAEDRLPVRTGEVAYDTGRRPEIEPAMPVLLLVFHVGLLERQPLRTVSRRDSLGKLIVAQSLV